MKKKADVNLVTQSRPHYKLPNNRTKERKITKKVKDCLRNCQNERKSNEDEEKVIKMNEKKFYQKMQLKPKQKCCFLIIYRFCHSPTHSPSLLGHVFCFL